VRTVILVHGLWHGSWCWSRVTGQLAGRGIHSVAVDLDGHGLKSLTPVSWWGRPFDRAAFATEPSGAAAVTASSAARTLVEEIREIGGGEPCVVVAHSAGGAVATAAAELEPSLFARLVYVAAYAPVAGMSVDGYTATSENEGSMVPLLLAADPTATGTLRIDPGDRDRHAAIRETFYGDVDDATAAAAISLLRPDAPWGLTSETLTVTGDRYGTVPHTYVICTKDNALPVALQRRYVEEVNAVSSAPTAVAELDSSHSPFLSQPAALADVLAEAC
jgi:pimeloyl-ACP methyl ester carboxylesterase